MRLIGRSFAWRKAVASLSFALAAAALLWPIQYRAATGVHLYGLRNAFTFTGFSSQTCSWHLQFGHMASAIPPAPPLTPLRPTTC